MLDVIGIVSFRPRELTMTHASDHDLREFLRTLPRPLPSDQIERVIGILSRMDTDQAAVVLGLLHLQSGRTTGAPDHERSGAELPHYERLHAQLHQPPTKRLSRFLWQQQPMLSDDDHFRTDVINPIANSPSLLVVGDQLRSWLWPLSPIFGLRAAAIAVEMVWLIMLDVQEWADASPESSSFASLDRDARTFIRHLISTDAPIVPDEQPRLPSLYVIERMLHERLEAPGTPADRDRQAALRVLRALDFLLGARQAIARQESTAMIVSELVAVVQQAVMAYYIYSESPEGFAEYQAQPAAVHARRFASRTLVQVRGNENPVPMIAFLRRWWSEVRRHLAFSDALTATLEGPSPKNYTIPKQQTEVDGPVPADYERLKQSIEQPPPRAISHLKWEQRPLPPIENLPTSLRGDNVYTLSWHWFFEELPPELALPFAAVAVEMLLPILHHIPADRSEHASLLTFLRPAWLRTIQRVVTQIRNDTYGQGVMNEIEELSSALNTAVMGQTPQLEATVGPAVPPLLMALAALFQAEEEHLMPSDLRRPYRIHDHLARAMAFLVEAYGRYRPPLHPLVYQQRHPFIRHWWAEVQRRYAFIDPQDVNPEDVTY